MTIFYFFLAVIMVVFAVAMLKSNLQRIPKQNMYMSVKENVIPSCRAGPLALVHMENFHRMWNSGKIKEIPPNQTGSLPI